MKDFEKTTDPTLDSPPGVIKPRGHAPAEGRDVSHVGPHSDAAALSAPELSHPANAAPLAELLTQLQQTRGNIHVQRVVAEMSEARSESQPRGSGQALDAGAKTQMESAFGENFGDVRVHTDGAAEKLNEELGAGAVTRGRNIYFGKDEYNPATSEGKKVLAHELTHVIQQRGSSSSQQSNSIGQVGDAFEQEADQAAASVLSGQRAHVANRSAAPASQRNQRGAQGIFEVPREVLQAGEVQDVGLGFFRVNLLLTSVPGAIVDTVHITVPAHVGVRLVDLSGMNLQVRDPGGQGRRVIIVVVNRAVREPRLIQVTFIKENWVYVCTYQLRVAPTPTQAPTAAPPPTPRGAH